MSDGMPETTVAEEVPACAAFEATLALVDGLLTGSAAAQARAHAPACAVCGPLVASWATTSAAFVAAFEDAAERAKPDLADLATRVLARVQPLRPTPKPVLSRAEGPSLLSRLARFSRLVQAPVALAAAAVAIALVVLPLAKAPAAPTAVAAAPEPNDLEMHKLAFDGADGMVFSTPTDHMTVIWVNEHPT